MVDSRLSAPSRVIHVVGAAIIDRGRCLAAQRGPTMQTADHWEFPGGKVEPGETPAAALVREIEEELGVEIEVGSWLGRGTASSGEADRVTLDVFVCRLLGGRPTAREHQALRWITVEEIADLDWAPADVPVLPALTRRLVNERLVNDGVPRDRSSDAPGSATEAVSKWQER